MEKTETVSVINLDEISLKSLLPVKIPQVGEKLQLTVSYAVSPDNFVIIAHSDEGKTMNKIVQCWSLAPYNALLFLQEKYWTSWLNQCQITTTPMTNPQAFQCPVLKKLALRVMLLLNLMTKNGTGIHLWNFNDVVPQNIKLMEI